MDVDVHRSPVLLMIIFDILKRSLSSLSWEKCKFPISAKDTLGEIPQELLIHPQAGYAFLVWPNKTCEIFPKFSQLRKL